MFKFILHLLLAFFLFSCQQTKPSELLYKGIEDIQQKTAFLTKITHPAGTRSDKAFLPYPANYGFFTENEQLEVVTITEGLEKEQTIAVYPVATLVLKENNMERNLIIAAPIDTALQVISVHKFQNFIISQVGIQQVIQSWFLYEKGLGKVDLVGWKNEEYAWKLLNE